MSNSLGAPEPAVFFAYGSDRQARDGWGGHWPMRVLPGDPATCFDVAIGPLPAGVAACDATPAALGLELVVNDNFHYVPRVTTPLPSQDGFDPVDRIAKLRLTWHPVPENSRMRADAGRAKGGEYLFFRACLEAEPTLVSRLWIAARAPAGALRGERVPDPDSPAGPDVPVAHAWSLPWLVEFGPARPPSAADPTETYALYLRARRLGLMEEALVITRQRAEIDPENALIHGTLGELLIEMRRPAEARAPLTRAVELCERDPECRDGRLENYHRWRASLGFPGVQEGPLPPK